MKTGIWISGIGHSALILWLLFGGLFTGAPDEPPLQVAEISVMSGEEFAALTQPQPLPESAAPDTAPAAPARPTPPAPEPEPAPAPEPEPEPEPLPEPEPAAPEPPAPESTPADIDRVAPEAAPEPEPEVEIAPEATPQVAPADEGEQLPEEEQPETAPEAATTEIVTEATETEDMSQFAPSTSARPRARPERPTPAPAPEPEANSTEVAAADPLNDAVADAVAEAVSETTAAVPVRPSGPPMTRGERDALRVAVGNCWNVGSLSTAALATTVVVTVSMQQDGTPDIGSIRMVSYSGGAESAAKQAYETARRAIIRCGGNGYNLPTDKYDQWQEIEMTFNPENMRIK